MNIRELDGPRQLAIAAAAVTLALTVSTVGAAGAAPTAGSASVASDTLTVDGTNASDRLALRLAPADPGTVQVDFGDDGTAEHSFDRSDFGTIEVSLRNGSDVFRIDQVNGAFADEALTVYGGNGDDTIDGGDANESIFGGRGSDAVNGHRGVDTAHLGSGDDSFRWLPGDGSDVVEGEAGTDTLDFVGADGSEQFTLSRNGERELFARAQGGIRMDLDEVEIVALAALGGADTVTIEDLTATDILQAEIDLAGATGGVDGAGDVVTVNGTDQADQVDVQVEGPAVAVTGVPTQTRIVGAELLDGLQVNTGGGDDSVDVDEAAITRIGVRVDLGADQS